MKNGLYLWVVLLLLGANRAGAQGRAQVILPKDDMLFLESMTKEVMNRARVGPGARAGDGPQNNSGGTLITPGGNYPAFWIRDYAMSLETGFVTATEQKHMLDLTAATQCDQTWISPRGAMIPLGSIADHIRMDDRLPVYFPGTYSFQDQGDGQYGWVPPYCDQFFFIQMAWYYGKSTRDKKFLVNKINGVRLIDRLEMAFAVPPAHAENGIVFTTDAFRGVDFGFRDVITITGDLCLASLLRFRAATQLSELFAKLNDQNKQMYYERQAELIRKAIPVLFKDDRGMLRASTGKSSQPDVWATALAIYWEVLSGDDALRASNTLADAYTNGTLAYKGNIRHVLTTDDHSPSTSWEFSLADKNTYQNGAYWGTPTGWVAWAIAKTKPQLATQLIGEFVQDLREQDFRKGAGFGAPYECFHPPAHKQNAVYMTTVACPYTVFMQMIDWKK
jgi:hypothetical protein